MPNPLTGEFDVAVELSVDGIDLVLAAQHQEGRYLHSDRFRVPPADTDDGSGIRGIAAVQTSTPTITLPSDGDSRVSAHYQLMVHMKPFASSVEIAEFVHGELRVSVDAQRVVSDMGEHIRIDLEADDVDVIFTPDSDAPLPPDQESAVAGAIDHFMRNGFEPLNQRIHLPDTGEAAVRHWRFKTLPGGTPPAVALLLNLRDREPTAAHVRDFTSAFLERRDHFALAVGADFLISELHDMIRNALEEHVDGLRVRVSRRWLKDCRYTIRVDLDRLRVEARDGRIEIEIRGRANGNRWSCPDYSFTIRQGFALEPSSDGKTVRLAVAGDLELDVSGFLARVVERRIRGTARDARDQMIREAQPTVEEIFASFGSFLGELDLASLDLRYRDVDMLADGIVVRGRFEVEWRDVLATYEKRVRPPQSPERPEPELELDAFRSWIPGGTVERYRWLYASERVVEHEIIEEHRFITRIEQRRLLTAGCLWLPCRWCLEVRGTQGKTASGGPREVVGWYCNIIGGGGIVDIPPVFGGGDFRLPLPLLDPSGEIVGHLDLTTTGDGGGTTAGSTSGTGALQRGRSVRNLVVHFPGSSLDGVTAIREVLDGVDRSDRRPVAIVVVEAGAAERRKTLQEELSQSSGLVVAEDVEGGWASAFEVSNPPATLLIDSRGQLAWKEEGPIGRQALEAALKEHVRPVRPLQVTDLGPRLEEEGRVPDFLFEYAEGQRMAMRTLRGDPVILSFWTSWSEASIAELRSLRSLHDQFVQQGLVILAINDGEDPQAARARFEQEQLPFQFVPDPRRRIARLLGIRVWPTTVLVDGHQTVRRIQLGLTPEEAAFDRSVASCMRRPGRSSRSTGPVSARQSKP